MGLARANTLDAPAFRSAPKTKSAPSAAGPIWRGGASDMELAPDGRVIAKHYRYHQFSLYSYILHKQDLCTMYYVL